MINALKKLFSSTDTVADPISYQKAVAALLLEVVIADDEIHPSEEQSAKEAIKSVSDLGEDIDRLFDDVKNTIHDANDAYQFTKVINEQASLEQKFELLKCLWRVAYADGNLDAHEDHRIRKISELLFMQHSEFIQAKLAVLEEMK
ncbi:MAG: TerB family tellurite resistance protein [Pseudomonadota bacterium]|uniref:Putative tellurite resistance protein B-like protein n=1 Tax=Marinomonas communis TaxID=28254 RepID=A0A4R6X7S5_9GAMM|nr:TerB family tellurite resistance protein [Marinomonas communis]MEC8080857.1 TerB family tellurite resistance protein [Pseudomonadota bacterium]TDR15096.1 putative tellurite resistance protein B-like protein [Marinomonas communis]